ncbi:DUF3515 domain-containing protein [Corynebacterium timonense]|uniref:DUF3515 domain-containing protein n=1 Tax=Corynebacterium timonense TaxID=441500 RepID=A0A1H1PQU9_9CORY|nr:DUF3515 domain-containing protein [Corynebacterium timonense]SDS13534.1 Protein of unknown function [Corynebacterium timonense]
MTGLNDRPQTAPGSTAATLNAPQFSRGLVIAILALALALVGGVLIGARVVYDRVNNQPVAMTPLPSPLADSPECAAFVDQLPDRVDGHLRAELAEPAPDGAAAWQASPTERITLRCGVDLPQQYNEYTPTTESQGVRWMRVDDPTAGSTFSTWYTVDRVPAVAVTSEETGGFREDPPSGIGAQALPRDDIQPAPAPLSGLAPGPAEGCSALMADLPEQIADGFEPLDVDHPDTAVWVAEGREPIVVRCGVAEPENYEAGAQLYQINDVTWFEDTTLANGTTSSTWFALGRTSTVAAHLPQAEGNEAVTALTEAISRTVPER